MDAESAGRLLDLLAARRGLVAAVGAGGKKSTLYRLAEAHRLIGSARVGLTCTVSWGAPPDGLVDARLVAAPERLAAELPALAQRHRLLAYAQPSPKPGRLGGLPGALIGQLHDAGDFTVTLVKADGARMRWIKAPRDDEPVLPAGVATVLPVVSIRALGRPLEPTIAHRHRAGRRDHRRRPGRAARPDPPRAPADQRGGRAAAQRRCGGGAGHQHGRRCGPARGGARGGAASRWRRAAASSASC